MVLLLICQDATRLIGRYQIGITPLMKGVMVGTNVSGFKAGKPNTTPVKGKGPTRSVRTTPPGAGGKGKR